MQVIPQEQLEVLSAYPALIELLKYILVRPPIARPTPDLISARSAFHTLPSADCLSVSPPLHAGSEGSAGLPGQIAPEVRWVKLNCFLSGLLQSVTISKGFKTLFAGQTKDVIIPNC